MLLVGWINGLKTLFFRFLSLTIGKLPLLLKYNVVQEQLLYQSFLSEIFLQATLIFIKIIGAGLLCAGNY